MCSREQGFYQTGGTEMTAKQTPLVDLLRVHADDIHSAHGHNKSSTLLSRAADRIDALEEEHESLRAELASWQEAFGLLTTLHGSMQIDVSDPLRMAKSIEGHVRAELAECKRDVEIVRFLRCGGWEVLQNPKYWTLENKFYGAIAEAMAEVAAEGDKNGDA